jgi:hypothetical protein
MSKQEELKHKKEDLGASTLSHPLVDLTIFPFGKNIACRI